MYVYVYMYNSCVEREREMVKREETINNNKNKENYKLQNNITYIQTCAAPAIIHTYIAVYTYLIFYYIYYHEITKLLQQK